MYTQNYGNEWRISEKAAVIRFRTKFLCDVHAVFLMYFVFFSKYFPVIFDHKRRFEAERCLTKIYNYKL